MPNFTVTIRKTEPECNPEYTTITVDAPNETAARAKVKQYEPQMKRPVAERSFRPGWNSKAEPEFWGKPLGLEVVEVKEQ